MEWPSEVWTVSGGTSDGHHLFGELVAGGAPAFLDFDRAAMAFFGLRQSPNRRFAGGEVVFRQQDRRGRIASVHVRPTELVVEVAGEALGGCSLTLGGDSSSPTRS